MSMRDEERRALIDVMLEARTAREVKAAEKTADDWLKDNPGDIRVIAANERLAGTSVAARDPERKVDQGTLAVLTVVFSSVALAAGALTGSWYAALAAGFLIALPVTELVWGILYDRSTDGAGHREGER